MKHFCQKGWKHLFYVIKDVVIVHRGSLNRCRWTFNLSHDGVTLRCWSRRFDCFTASLHQAMRSIVYVSLYTSIYIYFIFRWNIYKLKYCVISPPPSRHFYFFVEMISNNWCCLYLLPYSPRCLYVVFSQSCLQLIAFGATGKRV